MTSKIHLIEHLGQMTRLDKDQQEWESGYWSVSSDTADKLVGGHIYFHKAQSKPSFFGGIILGYRLESEGDLAGRTIFRFKAGQEFKDILAGTTGWGMEKKIVA